MATRKFKFKHIAQDASQYVGDAGELILDGQQLTHSKFQMVQQQVV
jgi:hypothetical protein